ncbi:hypothetical protein HID58_006198 [Brassica napus]|uniref:Uncharacterized protein n=2 Tax=Brassica TaxID=3705 RepID=A0ABQ7WZM0_BRANA|nr:hypothetical protein HID58_091545 [Brassica napus]KAH0938737.1 hypothetical protein HID58_006198 [Brassica napus]
MLSLSPPTFSHSSPRLPGSRQRPLAHGLASHGDDQEKELLRDVVGFLKSLGNYEKSGVPKGATTDSGDAFIW